MPQLPANKTATAQDYALELARWYRELAGLCAEAAERTAHLTEECSEAELDEALSIANQVGIRMASVQSAERVFRNRFPRMFIDHNVKRILALDSGTDTKSRDDAAGN